jgi:hypothetical protein
MDRRQAQQILMCYRPGATGASDPQFAQALEQARQDPELSWWFEQHRAFQTAIGDRFKELPVPAGLKERILAGYRPPEIIVWWRRPAFRALAAAAAITLMIGLAWFWRPPREDNSFAAFRSRVVRNAQRGYAMDLTTTNLNEIRRYLATHEGLVDYQLPAALEKLPGEGCAVLRWHNKIVSMVCFDPPGDDNDLYLFVASRSDLPDAPSSNEPQFNRIGKLTAASWSAGGKTYVLAGRGDEQFIRKYLGP